MNAMIPPHSAPHIGSEQSVTRIMLMVMLALLPATLFGLYQFGWPALNVFILCLATALLAEAACRTNAFPSPLTDDRAFKSRAAPADDCWFAACAVSVGACDDGPGEAAITACGEALGWD